MAAPGDQVLFDLVSSLRTLNASLRQEASKLQTQGFFIEPDPNPEDVSANTYYTKPFDISAYSEILVIPIVSKSALSGSSSLEAKAASYWHRIALSASSTSFAVRYEGVAGLVRLAILASAGDPNLRGALVIARTALA